MANIAISTMIVVYNAGKYLEGSLGSLIKQSIGHDQYEILIVDGGSVDGSLDIALAWKERYPNLIRIFSNPKRTLAAGWNLGVREARGDIILRIDAHSEVPDDFLQLNLEALESRKDVAAVGGQIITRGSGLFGRAVAILLSSFFGVGDSRFRIGGKPGNTDTIVYGAYHRWVFDRIGYFDETLIRNQDLDFHKRMRDEGLKLYLDPKICSIYYSRSDLKSFLDQAFRNGFWNMLTTKSVSLRHVVPAVFLLVLVITSLLIFVGIRWPFAMFLSSYVGFGIYSSIVALARHKAPEALVLPALGFLLHSAYGLGSWWAILKTIMAPTVRFRR